MAGCLNQEEDHHQALDPDSRTARSNICLSQHSRYSATALGWSRLLSSLFTSVILNVSTRRCRPDNAMLSSASSDNLTNLRGSLLCVNTFLLSPLFFFLMFQDSFKNSFPFYFRVDLSGENPLTIPVSRIFSFIREK